MPRLKGGNVDVAGGVGGGGLGGGGEGGGGLGGGGLGHVHGTYG